MPSIYSSFSRGLSSGLRLFARQPTFAFTCVAILALGFTFSATLFSTAYSLLLRPLPFEEAERWFDVKIQHVGASGPEPREILPTDFSAWRRGMADLDTAAFETLAAYSMHMGILNGPAGGGAAYVTAEVTADVLAMTGVTPLLGRTIQPGDEKFGAPRVAVIDAELWRRHFAEERQALGSSFQLNGEVVTLIGVVPAGFAFPHSQKIWLNLRVDASSKAPPLSLIGMLAPGSSTDVAADQLESMLAERPTGKATAPRVVLEPLALSQADPRLRSAVTPLLFGVAALLLVACANVTSLLLGRGLERSHEIALHQALGARRSSVAGAQFGECLVLTMSAAGLGLLLARAGVGLVERLLAPGDLLHAAWMEIRLDPPVVGATLLLALVVAVLSSLLPMWRATRIAVSDVLREGSRAHSKRSAVGGLVIAEVALAVAMLAGGGVLLHQVSELRAFEPGFAAEHRTAAKVSFHAEDKDSSLFFAQVVEKLVAHPEIEGVAFASSLPTEGSFAATWQLENREPAIESRWLVVSPGFFDVAEVELLGGRPFDAGLDRRDAPLTAIVNRSFVDRFLAGEKQVLGQRLQPVRDSSRADEDPQPWLEIVGVVEDTVMGPVGDDRGPAAIYLSSTQRPRRAMAMIVSGRNGTPAERLLRTEMAAVDERAVSFDYRSLQSMLTARSWLYDLLATLFVCFAGASLVLTLGGVYGVVVAATRQQRKEYGIRLALGARRQQLLMSVLRTSLLRLAVGIGVGLLLCALAARVFSSLLHQAAPSVSSGWMIWSALGTTLLVVVTGLAASLPPALKTSRIDPVETLRSL